MTSYKPEEEIVEVEPIGSDSSSKTPAKNTEAGVRPEMREIDALPSNTTERGPVNAGKRMELKRVATELHGIEFGDSVLDPTSPDFDVYKWAKMVLCAADKADVKLRRASFTFKNLVVSGSGSAAHFQANVASIFMTPFRLHEYFSFGKKPETKILNRFDGVTKSGEILLVLGRPGSGCSTFLKTIAGELHGLKIGKDSVVHYNGIVPRTKRLQRFGANRQQGIPQEQMIRNFKGEIIYNQEVDKHFPHLTVRQTLEFAATVRTPRNHVVAVSRKDNVKQVTAVVMAICGLTHTQNTKVGNDFVRGVSGGERKVTLLPKSCRSKPYANLPQASQYCGDDIGVILDRLLGQ